MDLWNTIGAFMEGHWGYAIGGLLGLTYLTLLAVRQLRVVIRNVRDMSECLGGAALGLSGTYKGRGLFGRRPTIRGTRDGMPVVVDFPENWRASILGNDTVASQVWLRIRLTVPRGIWARVRRRHALDDLIALGLPAEMVQGEDFRFHVEHILPNGSRDLVIRRGVATVWVPVEWDAAQLPAWRVLGLVESAHAVVREVCGALASSRKTPAAMSAA